MKISRILPVSLQFVLLTMTGIAQQGEVRMTASIAGATPLGQFKDLTDKTSFRGADINIIYGLSDALGIGLNIGFQDFYKKYPRALYKMADGSDISAVITNSIQTIPFLATARYNFTTDGFIHPYVSAGAGGAAVLNKQYIGEYPNESNKISFAARPSAGVYIPFKKEGEVGVNLGVNYTFIPYKQDDISNLSYFGFTIGVGFPMRN